MTRSNRADPKAVDPLGLDPNCPCVVCLAGHGDSIATAGLIDRLFDVVVEARTPMTSDEALVKSMRRGSRRSELAPALVDVLAEPAVTDYRPGDFIR